MSILYAKPLFSAQSDGPSAQCRARALPPTLVSPCQVRCPFYYLGVPLTLHAWNASAAFNFLVPQPCSMAHTFSPHTTPPSAGASQGFSRDLSPTGSDWRSGDGYRSSLSPFVFVMDTKSILYTRLGSRRANRNRSRVLSVPQPSTQISAPG